MDQSNIISPFLLILFLFLIDTKAQNPADSAKGIPQQGDSISNNFQPSLAVVMGLLSIMFSFTFVLLLYAKFCHHTSSPHDPSRHIQDGLLRSRPPPSGVDKTVIESLPFFRFSSLRGSREGLECAVCLSKFEDIEILRLLPKCKHAFHIDCIDQWLGKHATCPLCRQMVGSDDLSRLAFSDSLRCLLSQTEPMIMRDEDSNLELYVEREENRSQRSSSRFSIGSSFRIKRGKEEELLPIQKMMEKCSDDHEDMNMQKPLHRFNHKIVVSDVILKNRWSSVSSSDLMLLNSEMLGDLSSARFSNTFEQKQVKSEYDDHQGSMLGGPTTSGSEKRYGFGSKVLNQDEKRSMSEILVHSRFNIKDSANSYARNDVEDEMIMRRRVFWLPIARKTVLWFASRETRPPDFHHTTQNV